MPVVKAWEQMSITELEAEYTKLSNSTYDSEWLNEFTRLELKELRKLIESKRNLVKGVNKFLVEDSYYCIICNFSLNLEDLKDEKCPNCGHNDIARESDYLM